MNKTLTDLLPCPFCGGTNCTISTRTIGKWKFVYCPDCLAEGPAYDDEDDAIDAWNRRTTPDREAIIEECAKVCDDRIMGDQSERDFESKRCAEAIRALKTAPTISPRDTLIEEIAEMVDHMGEGRRLEEYVGAIREMKSGDKGGA
ncbi:Lar family restriction alleviation protein [Burkholderia vietnamiensis]|uniref:Lar family restriction alleviation protein n=1 Tax=Burkholderia vietnamiensis TaxID=60552 RepID=UPI00158ECEE0|nr:Lar family restriction alleviation protein [Burkholderia vietnamiensis]